MRIYKNKLFNNTMHLYILTIVKMVFPLLILPYLARVLSKDIYGFVTYTKTWMQYMQLVIDFGFILSATKLIVESKNKNNIGRIIGDTLVEKCILCVISLMIILIAIYNIGILKYNILFVLLSFFSVCLTIFLFDFLFRGIEEMGKLSIPLIVSKFISTVFTFVFVKSDQDIMYIVFLDILGNIIGLLISSYFVIQKRYNITFSNYKKWFADLKDSFIYFLSNFSTTVFGAFTTVIIGIYLLPKDVASWGLCMQIVNAIKSIYSPIINTFYPYMLRDKNINLIKTINKLMGVIIMIGVIIILLYSEEIIFYIAGKKYIEVSIIIKKLIPIFIFSYYSMIYGWPVLGAIGKVKETTYTTIFSALIQIVLIFLLIKIEKLNLINLALITSLSEFTLFLSRYILYKKFKYRFSKNYSR